MLGTAALTDINAALLPSRRRKWFTKARRSLSSGTVADVMNFDVVTVPLGTSLADAVDAMDLRSTERILVLDAEAIVGIVTPTDVARGLVSRGAQRSETRA